MEALQSLIAMGYRPLKNGMMAKPIGNANLVYDLSDNTLLSQFRGMDGKFYVNETITLGDEVGCDVLTDGVSVTVEKISCAESMLLYNLPKGDKNFNFAFLWQ